MPYLLVLGLSFVVGGAVYLVTVQGEHDVGALGFADDGEPTPDDGVAPAAGRGYAYLRVSTEGPSIRDRLQGFVGVLILIGVGAALLALAIYQLGHVINLLIEGFLDS